jgi:hypothetical protein
MNETATATAGSRHVRSLLAATPVFTSDCLSGELLVSVLDTGSTFASFTVGAGQMFHIESGSLHHIENIGSEPAELIVAFRHERLAATLETSQTTLPDLPFTPADPLLVGRVNALD